MSLTTPLEFTKIKVFGYQLEQLANENLPLKSKSIDVSNYGVPYVVTQTGYIFHREQRIWKQIPGLANDITVTNTNETDSAKMDYVYITG